jgi:hypothetical protein
VEESSAKLTGMEPLTPVPVFLSPDDFLRYKAACAILL